VFPQFREGFLKSGTQISLSLRLYILLSVLNLKMTLLHSLRPRNSIYGYPSFRYSNATQVANDWHGHKTTYAGRLFKPQPQHSVQGYSSTSCTVWASAYCHLHWAPCSKLGSMVMKPWTGLTVRWRALVSVALVVEGIPFWRTPPPSSLLSTYQSTIRMKEDLPSGSLLQGSRHSRDGQLGIAPLTT
jgi:hypothetical protein